MIHSFGKRRSIRARASAEARKRQETRDAILWAIYPDTRKCTVKIQGSNSLITAFYPENWTSTPKWLKPGNSVRILHTGGKRNRIEVVGDGGTVPTPVNGGSAGPTIGAGADCIISGMDIVVLDGLVVTISSGTYRINDVLYTVSLNIVMGAEPIQTMGVIPVMVMGSGVYALPLTAASSIGHRIDAFFIGVDGVIDYVAGSVSATSPVAPDTPTGHVLIGTVFVPKNCTALQQWYVNYTYVAPFAAQLTVNPGYARLTWEDDSADISVSVKDQYGVQMSGTWQVLSEITDGTGSVDEFKLLSTNGSGTITYRRPTNYDVVPYPEEHCPIFITMTLLQDSDVTAMVAVLIEDEFGNIIT